MCRHSLFKKQAKNGYFSWYIWRVCVLRQQYSTLTSLSFCKHTQRLSKIFDCNIIKAWMELHFGPETSLSTEWHNYSSLSIVHGAVFSKDWNTASCCGRCQRSSECSCWRCWPSALPYVGVESSSVTGSQQRRSWNWTAVSYSFEIHSDFSKLSVITQINISWPLRYFNPM